MNLFGRLFQKKRITFCGRAGLVYELNDQKYFVDSELLSGKPDIVLYADVVRQDNGKGQIVENKLKAQIIDLLIVELEKQGLVVEIHPPLSH